MNSLSAVDHRLQRHALVDVEPSAWRGVLDGHQGRIHGPIVDDWAERGWPLAVRRPQPGDAPGLPLGLPLPRSLGKRRLSVVVPHVAVAARHPPLLLAAAEPAAPRAWRDTVAQLLALADRHGTEICVFGSLAWAALTGLDYLGPSSDLDVLLPLPRSDDVASLTSGLAAIAGSAPMRLDGELVRRDGSAVHWREIHGNAADLLVKTATRAALVARADFLGEGDA